MTAKTLCYCAHNVNTGVGGLCFFKDILYRFGTVSCGLCVGHCKKLCYASGSCGTAAGDDILLAGLSRVTKMDMKVDKSRCRCQSGTVNDLCTGSNILSRGEAAAAYINVSGSVHIPDGVKYMYVFYYYLFHIILLVCGNLCFTGLGA